MSVVAARRVLRSAAMGALLVPRAHLANVQRTAFSVVGPSALNDLPVGLRSLLMTHPSKFNISLKSFFFGRDRAGNASAYTGVLKRRYISLQNKSKQFLSRMGENLGETFLDYLILKVCAKCSRAFVAYWNPCLSFKIVMINRK